MTKEEVIRELEKLVGDSDPEDAHLKADGILLEFIGDVEITRLYNLIEKWYA